MSVRCSTETPGGMRQVVHVDAHTLVADTTAANGGGTAPDPHDLFDASLATCTAITATLYARRKGMKLDRVIVEVVRDASREAEGTYVLDLRVAFEGDLDNAERSRLHDIAGRCPIHRLMTTKTIEVRTGTTPPTGT